MDLPPISSRYNAVVRQLHHAEQLHQRTAGTVAMLAVSKTRSANEIEALVRLGQRSFGENYLQESLEKIRLLADLNLDWHFIGPIQSNKTSLIAENFSWVHSVDRLKIAKRLSQQRPADLGPLNVCLQVNIDNEATKSGCQVDELPELMAAVRELPNLRLRGLMVIPQATDTLEQQRLPFAKARQLLQGLNEAGAHMDTLSMGMSRDLEAAVAEGSTMVRIGTALFGPRN